MTILIFHNGRSWVDFRSVYDKLAQIMKVICSNRLWIRQFTCKYWWYADFIGLNVHIRRNDGTRRKVDAFSLSLCQNQPKLWPSINVPSCACGISHPSSQDLALFPREEVYLGVLVGGSCWNQ